LRGEDRQSRLEEFVERPRRAVWIIAAPMMAGFAVHALYSVVDAAFIGQLGPEALAAATYVGALFFVAIALSNGLASGVTALLAQAIGRRDTETAERLASGGLGIGLIIGAGLCIVGMSAGPLIIPLLGAEGETADLAWEYFQVLSAAMPLMLTSTAIRAVLNGEGDARTPMLVLTVATGINIALDPIFIFTLELGVRGAALATAAAALFSLSAFSYIAFVRKKMFTRFRASLVLPRLGVIGPVARIGVPAAATYFVMAVGMALTNRVLSEFGHVAVAGYGAAHKVDLMVALPVLGLAGASMTVIGMFAGASRADLVRSTALYVYRWALIAAAALGVSAYVSATWVIGLFTDDAAAIEIGTTYLTFALAAYPLMSVGMVSGRVLQGIGYGLPSLIITLTRVLGVAIPGAYVAVYAFGAPIESVWISMIAGILIAGALGVGWVRAKAWGRDPTALAGAGAQD
jgi:putative MATE family efflux protein